MADSHETTGGGTRPGNGSGQIRTVLALRRISKRFKSGGRAVEALRDISLDIPAGGITGLIGPDGAGKTSLMRTAAGLLRPDSGDGTVLGFDLRREARAIQSAIGYMPQRFGLYDDLSVQENLDLYADLKGIAPRLRAERYRELMQMTGLAPFMRRLAGRLSGGMKQKLGLACALVNPPRLLLLDEPTVGVDPVSRRELWQIVDRFVREHDTGVLLSTAYLDEAERCSQVIVLHEGRILAQQSPGEIARHLSGRVYRLTVPDRKQRELQGEFSRRSGVLDAVVQAKAVRLVLDTTAAQDPDALTSGLEGAILQPATPRFEDAFVVMLGEKMAGRRRPTASPAASPVPAETLSATGDPVVEVRDVERRFGDFVAVTGLTFDVHRGEVFGLLGANGAGKTTTFRMLCGLLPASSGSLHISGVDVRKTAAAARARIGYMSQKFSLYGDLSVGQNLEFFGSAYGLQGTHKKSRFDWAVDQFELAGIVETTSSHLSLGHKQRLALACALMHEPDILFLDEPTSGVDPLTRREFWHRISALAARRVTVLVTTHFMEEAEYCDRLAIMVAGEVLALGTPTDIKRRARTADLLQPSMEDAFIHVIQSQPGDKG